MGNVIVVTPIHSSKRSVLSCDSYNCVIALGLICTVVWYSSNKSKLLQQVPHVQTSWCICFHGSWNFSIYELLCFLDGREALIDKVYTLLSCHRLIMRLFNGLLQSISLWIYIFVLIIWSIDNIYDMVRVLVGSVESECNEMVIDLILFPIWGWLPSFFDLWHCL